MRVGIVADPLASLKPQMDTTLLIADECRRRGYDVRYVEIQNIYRTQDGPVGDWMRFEYDAGAGRPPAEFAGPAERGPMDAMDIVLMRQDPPVEERYIGVTHILAGCSVPVVNDPASVQQFNEKISILDLPDHCPPSMVAMAEDAIVEFWRASDTGAVVKPLNEYSGHGVAKLAADADEADVRKQIRVTTRDSGIFCMVQKFIPDVVSGDKRFFLVNGKSIGHMLRVPPAGDWRSNIHLGARPEAFEPTARDLEILDGVAALLSCYDLPITCIDIIGDFLSEINVTSPSGIPEINRISGPGHEKPIVDALEEIVNDAGR